MKITSNLQMAIRIIDQQFTLDLYGFSGTVPNRNFNQTGFRLMNDMRRQIKSRSLKNKGLNTWVYLGCQHMFVGAELEGGLQSDTGLIYKNVDLQNVPTVYTPGLINR